MQTIKTLATSVDLVKKYTSIVVIAILVLITAGCDESSSDTDESGFVKIYNASVNAPTIYLDVDGEKITQADYTNSSALYPQESNSYDITLSWKADSNDYETFYEEQHNITDNDVEFLVVAGDFNNPEIITYQYPDEQDSLSDESDESNFTFRLVNLYQGNQALDIYISEDSQTFNEATLAGSVQYQEMSDSQYYELDSYVLYITEQGSDDVLFKSEVIDFFANTQYILVVRDNYGPGDSPFSIDKISKNSATIVYSDENARAKMRIYNGMVKHDLLEGFENEVSFTVNGLQQDYDSEPLAKGSFSDDINLPSGDYSMNFRSTEDESFFATNHFISLNSNQDESVFLYLTEEKEDHDNNSTTEDQVSIFVNTLPVTNSHRVSLYDHQINVINLVQDAQERFNYLQVSFVKSNETVSTTEFKLSSYRAKPSTIVLPNNTYQVNVIAKVGDSELLLVFDELTLDSDSGDLFMIIEEDTNSSTGYVAQFVLQTSVES